MNSERVDSSVNQLLVDWQTLRDAITCVEVAQPAQMAAAMEKLIAARDAMSETIGEVTNLHIAKWVEITPESMPEADDGCWSRPVLVYDGHSIKIDAWFNGGTTGTWARRRGHFHPVPTYWMQLPGIPK